MSRALLDAAATDLTPAVDAGTPGDADRVTDLLDGLNPIYRAALVLRHVDGLSVPEVAGLLARSIDATEQVLTRAPTAFRSAYSNASGANHA